jgi:hypothetical protein
MPIASTLFSGVQRFSGSRPSPSKQVACLAQQFHERRVGDLILPGGLRLAVRLAAVI